jgi:nitrite reductase/ring-hydroxylating ferredoxin subunit
VNPARPAAGVRLCALAEIDDPGARGFVFRAGDALFMGFVVKVGREVMGYVDHCPHAGFPIANIAGRYLTREGDLILCAAHGALFRRGDGMCVSGPCAGKLLTRWPVRIDGEAVFTG